MQQYHNQSRGSLRSELIVVAEGDESKFIAVKKRWASDTFVCKPDETWSGDGAKDLGITLATGEYVCFWDDDNIYHPHALATLYATAKGYDIGIVKINIHGPDNFFLLPQAEELGMGLCDTMNFCVRRELALQETWMAGENDYCDDWNWMSRLLAKNPSVRNVDISIGEKLNR
jgi:glycosyltransferase involved in cell wall biosynthesis